MARYRVRFEIDEEKAKKAVSFSDGIRDALYTGVARITGRANAMSAGFRTGRFYSRDDHELRGNTQPKYAGSIMLGSYGWVGLVHPKNYAAMKDNHLHNTLLKSKRG